MAIPFCNIEKFSAPTAEEILITLYCGDSSSSSCDCYIDDDCDVCRECIDGDCVPIENGVDGSGYLCYKGSILDVRLFPTPEQVGTFLEGKKDEFDAFLDVVDVPLSKGN